MSQNACTDAEMQNTARYKMNMMKFHKVVLHHDELLERSVSI